MKNCSTQCMKKLDKKNSNQTEDRSTPKKEHWTF